MSERLSRKSWMIVAVVIFLFALIIQGIKAAMVSAAQREVDRVGQSLSIHEKSLDELQQELTSAKQKHLSAYTKDISLAQEQATLRAAQQFQGQATRVRHPNEKRRLAQKASEGAEQITGVLTNKRQYLRLLDTALANYQAEPGKLAQASVQVRQYLGSLEKEGYFPANFTESRRLLAAADERHHRVTTLSHQRFEGERPDYLVIYTTGLEGEKFSRDAQKLAEAVVILRAANEARITQLPKDAPTVRQSYEPAWVAVNQLERYPHYRSRKRVERTNESFVEMERLWLLSKEQNSMAKQEFTRASQSLSQAEGLLANANKVFSATISTWQKVQSAIRDISSAKSAAKEAIDRAHRHIRANSHNSQGRAKGLVEDAEAKLSEGNLLRPSDPPQSLGCFREAEELAEEAYRAVDTSTETTTTTSPFPSTGGFGGGGLSGGGSIGGGGGSIGGGGGGFGGPSGGGFGHGGF